MQTVQLSSAWRRLLLLASFFGGASVAEAREIGRAETLQAIRAVENPRDVSRPGKYGELGPYQFRRATWRMHTTAPFGLAVNRDVAEQVAVRHYEWLRRWLVRHGITPSAYNIALAWNSGLTSVARGGAPARAHDYASRVHNLAQEFSAMRLASAE